MVEEKSFYQQGHELAMDQKSPFDLQSLMAGVSPTDGQEMVSGYLDGQVDYILNGIRDDIRTLPKETQHVALTALLNQWEIFMRLYRK